MYWLIRMPFFAVLLCTAQLASVDGRAEEHPFELYHYRAIDDTFSTSGQIREEEIGELAELGFGLVVNLATADPQRNAREAFLVAQEGIAYVNIPVVWDRPTLEDLRLYFDVMDARGARRTLVHCFANYRASAFTYLYRTLRLGVDEATARADFDALWNEEVREQYPHWIAFVDRARLALRSP